MENIYSLTEASKYLRVSIRTLYRWEKKGLIIILNINGNRRIKESEIKKIMGETNE